MLRFGRRATTWTAALSIGAIALAGRHVAACGDDDGGGGAGTAKGQAMVVGHFDAEGAGCARGVAKVRVIQTDGGRYESALGPGCTFAVTADAGAYGYLQALDAGGNALAVAAWEDPTRFNDGLSVNYTSVMRFVAGSYGLGHLGFFDAENVQRYSLAPVTINGGPGPYLLVEYPPTQTAVDADGVPDSLRTGYMIGTTSADRTVAFGPVAAECTLPTAGTLHGRFQVVMARRIGDNLTPEQHATLVANPKIIPPGYVMTPEGFQSPPITLRSLWVSFGDRNNPDHVVMADPTGAFTIDAATIPPGVIAAQVYRDLGDVRPLAYLPLCLLKSDPASANQAPFVQQRMFNDPCTMNSVTTTECHGAPDAREDAHDDAEDERILSSGAGGVATRSEPPRFNGHTHTACGAGNQRPGCCLDYDGPLQPAGSGRPHDNEEGGALSHIAQYFGSTCERYVDLGCCVNETGTIGERFAIVFAGGGANTVTCFRNHARRNCQNVDLTEKGLVFSANAATRDAHDPSTSPESITVGCGTTTTLFHYNNTCQNTDSIKLASKVCGTLDPTGTKMHHAVNPKNTANENILERDVVFTAPAFPCETRAVASAAGLIRIINIKVDCAGTVATQPPVTSPPEITVTPIKATFTQATFSTDYEVTVSNPLRHPLQVEWLGVNCGTQTPMGKSDPFAELSLNPKMTWSHPHPPCDPNTQHADAKISVVITGPNFVYRCEYAGAETGNGPACTKQ